MLSACAASQYAALHACALSATVARVGLLHAAMTAAWEKWAKEIGVR